ncbi:MULTISPECIES: TonB-dependent receptor domain-containing protein [unclassified Novosphingobium]|uniref:TonB-dependent receptor domain-containing protein n=1 Tax=unclassified Novosphingobium TaxID=2644732 RepID=UPI000B2EBAED|nr:MULTISPECIES: TonB-dependent receptor [unclassified Novosphingobium]TCM35420.1 TonB-dependent receptor-like protein [Novosphingobium sp. ST904]WRT95696.1 TonB-dependent receptor [Novosphingobium sp. RL4]
MRYNALAAGSAVARFRCVLMLSCLGLSAGALSTAAFAQTLPETAQDTAGENKAADIVVTGSRIRRAAADSPSPLSIVDADQIKATGTQNIADVVNQLPALAVTQTNQTSNLAGNAGVNALDLRGLGTQRTLVLVDGRRQVAAIPGTSAVDLSNIPSSLVQRVEVITGGASALYGADAVAGVANFILKKDFEGVEANTRYSASTRGDMDTYGFDLLAGANFADHRGNVTLYGFFENTPGTVSGADRPWTADGYPIYARTSSSSPYYIQDHVRNINTADAAQVVLGGRLYAVSGNGTLRDPILGPGGFVNAVPVNLGTSTEPLGTLLTDGGEYNGRYDGWFLSVPSQRINTRASASFEVSDALKLFANATFAHNTSKAGYLQMTAFGTDVVPADSPYITDEMRAANGGAVPAGGVQFARRFMELAAPRTEYDRTLFQAVTGAEGDFTLFSKPWNYSTYYSYGKTTERVRDVNSTAYDRWYLGLDSTTGPDGKAICRSTLDDPGNGCVAINPLVKLTPEMIDYITYTSHWSKSTLTQQVLSGYVSGGLFDLPGGAVQVVLGGEYRKERNDIGAIPEYNPDSPLYDPTIGTTAGTLVGKYSVKEVYGEVHVPLLAKTPFFETLSLDGALRLSDYSTAGSTTTWKIGGEWAPIRDIRFRATYGQAVRAPNIGELYTADSISGLWITDPCNTYNLANRATRTQYTAANCAAISPADTASYWLYRDIISSGNLDLKPETAKTLTVGAVMQPRFLPGLSLTVDYYNIDLRNAIDAFGAQTLIDKCVDQPTLDNIFCPLIKRDANGNLEAVMTQKLNLAQYLTRGIDFGLNYSVPLARLGLPDDEGKLSIDANYTRLLNRRYTLDPSDPNSITEYAGIFGSPKWKGVVRTTYSRDGLGFTWSLRHVSPMKASTTITKEKYSKIWTPNVFYNDFSAFFALTDNIELSGGLNNAFDRKPPRIPGAEAGGANFELSEQSGVYDVIGRTFFLSLRFHR